MSPRFRSFLSLAPFGAALSVVATVTVVALPGPEQVDPGGVSTAEVDLTQTAEPVAPGWVAESEVDANLVGVEWQGDPGASFTLETRDSDGNWEPAATVGPQSREEGPDDNTVEGANAAARAAAGNVTEPIWIGNDATAVRVVLDGGAPADVSLHTVDSEAPSTAAGTASAAGGMPEPGATDRDRLAVLLTGLGAGALVVGSRVWWRRRQLTRAQRSRSRRAALATASVLVLVALSACNAKSPIGPPTIPGMANIVTRAQWGADESLRVYPDNVNPGCDGSVNDMSQLKFAVVHHTAGNNFYTPQESASIVRGIYTFHTTISAGGYCDIAYNFLVDRYGQVFEGRYGGADAYKNLTLGAHARGFNSSSVGVSILGHFGETQVTPEAIEAVKQVIHFKFGYHGTNPVDPIWYTTAGNEKYPPNHQLWVNPVSYHAYTGSTECPGSSVIPKIESIWLDVANRLGYY